MSGRFKPKRRESDRQDGSLSIAQMAAVVNLGKAPPARLEPGVQPESSEIYTIHVGPRSLGGGDPIWTIASWLSSPELESLRNKISEAGDYPLAKTAVSGRVDPKQPIRFQLNATSAAELTSQFGSMGERMKLIPVRSGTGSIKLWNRDSLGWRLLERLCADLVDTQMYGQSLLGARIIRRLDEGSVRLLWDFSRPIGKDIDGNAVYLPDMGTDGGGLCSLALLIEELTGVQIRGFSWADRIITKGAMSKHPLKAMKDKDGVWRLFTPPCVGWEKACADGKDVWLFDVNQPKGWGKKDVLAKEKASKSPIELSEDGLLWSIKEFGEDTPLPKTSLSQQAAAFLPPRGAERTKKEVDAVWRRPKAEPETLGELLEGLSVASGERKLNRIRMGSTARASLEMLFVRGSRLMSCIQGCILVSDERYEVLGERQSEEIAREHRARIGLNPDVPAEKLGVWVAMMRTPQVVPHCLHVRRALRVSDLEEILKGGDLAKEVLCRANALREERALEFKSGSDKATLPTMDEFLREVKILAVSMTGAVLGGCFFAAFEDSEDLQEDHDGDQTGCDSSPFLVGWFSKAQAFWAKLPRLPIEFPKSAKMAWDDERLNPDGGEIPHPKSWSPRTIVEVFLGYRGERKGEVHPYSNARNSLIQALTMDPQGPTGLWSNAGVDVFIRIPWNWSDPRGAGQFKDWEKKGRLSSDEEGNFCSQLFLLWLACALAIQMSIDWQKRGYPCPGYVSLLKLAEELLYLTGNNPSKEERARLAELMWSFWESARVDGDLAANFCWDAAKLTSWLTAQLRLVYENEKAIPRVWAWKAADWREGVKKSWDYSDRLACHYSSSGSALGETLELWATTTTWEAAAERLHELTKDCNDKARRALEGAPADSVQAIREIFQSAQEGARLAAVSKAPAFVRWNDATASASIGSVSLAPFVKGMGEKAGISGWDVKAFLAKDRFWNLTKDQVLAVLWEEEGLPTVGTPLWKDLATLWKEQREAKESNESPFGDAAVELIKLEALKDANSRMAQILLGGEGQKLAARAEAGDRKAPEDEAALPLEVQPNLPVDQHSAGWYAVIERLQSAGAQTYWSGLKPVEVEEADWEKSRHRLLATAILFAEMPGVSAYGKRHWKDSRALLGGRLQKGQAWNGLKWFGGTTPFWTLVQWARSGVITPPSMPHSVAMAFVDGLSDDALISSPQWVGKGLVPVKGMKVLQKAWKGKEAPIRDWSIQLQLAGMNTAAKLSPFQKKWIAEKGMPSTYLEGTSLKVWGASTPLANLVKGYNRTANGVAKDKQRKRARETLNLWVKNVLIPLIGEGSGSEVPEWGYDPEGGNGW